jgi:hypothetical protein
MKLILKAYNFLRNKIYLNFLIIFIRSNSIEPNFFFARLRVYAC